MLREAVKEDSNAIKKLLEIMHRESRYHVFDINHDKVSRFIDFMIKDDDSLVLVISDNDDICAVFMARIDKMYFSDCKTASDHTFYVHPNYRGNGIATQMVGRYIDWALSKKADDIAMATSSGIPTSSVQKIADKFGMKKLGESYRLNYV